MNFVKLPQKDRATVIQAMKMYEDKIQAIITEREFDKWLDRIPLDVNELQYTAILRGMLHNLRKYRKPTAKQIELILDLGFANLKYNPT